MYKHFYIYTVWIDNLETFCNDIKIEYKNIFTFSKLRFLSIMPVFERHVQMYKPLKQYFKSIEYPTIFLIIFKSIWENFTLVCS